MKKYICILMTVVFAMQANALSVKAKINKDSSSAEVQAAAIDAQAISDGPVQIVRDANGKVTDVVVFFHEKDNQGIEQATQALLENRGVATVYIESPTTTTTTTTTTSTTSTTVTTTTTTTLPAPPPPPVLTSKDRVIAACKRLVGESFTDLQKQQISIAVDYLGAVDMMANIIEALEVLYPVMALDMANALINLGAAMMSGNGTAFYAALNYYRTNSMLWYYTAGYQ